jgi:hypothetical protein
VLESGREIESYQVNDFKEYELFIYLIDEEELWDDICLPYPVYKVEQNSFNYLYENEGFKHPIVMSEVDKKIKNLNI